MQRASRCSKVPAERWEHPALEGEEAAECLVKWDFHLVQEVSWLISAL